MAESSDELERLSREQLILKARVLGVERAELMTRVEMRDEIVRRSEPDIAQQKRARGFLGVARDLVASVVEAGLNLPDAAAIIRGDANRESHWKGPPPVATVTLAEIYAAQGHLDRALRMLDEVLAKEPDHDPARALRTRLATATDLPTAPPRRRQKISFADPSPIPVDVPVDMPVPAPADAPADVQLSDPPPDFASASASAPEPAPDFASAPEPASASASAPEPAPDFASASVSAPEPAPDFASASASAPEPAPDFAPASASAPEPGSDVAPAPAFTLELEPDVAPAPASSAAPEPVLEAEPSLIPAVAFALNSAPAVPPEPASANVNDPASASPLTPVPVPVPVPVPAPTLPAPALLTLSVSGQRQIYWELPAQSLNPLRAHSPGGRAVVRVISFRTRSGRVERHASDLTPDSEVGFAVLPDLRADAVVRAVLGWEAEGRFMPYLVASDLSSGSPSALRGGPFRANPLVGSVAHELELRALSYCSRRPAH